MGGRGRGWGLRFRWALGMDHLQRPAGPVKQGQELNSSIFNSSIFNKS